jgi:hypothetical protein
MPLRTTVASLAVSSAVLAGAVGYARPAAAESDIGPLVDYGFQCAGIWGPGLWYDCTGDRANVPAGWYVRVTNVSSGGKSVRFRAKNTAGDHLLGTSGWALPGQKVFVWRNDTGRTINIEFEADANALVHVTCNARAFITSS